MCLRPDSHPTTPAGAPRAGPSARARTLLSLGLVAALLGLLAAAVVRGRLEPSSSAAGHKQAEGGSPAPAQRELPILGRGPVPRFTLTDQEGRAFDSVSLGGKAWVANFIFTRCADTCPRMTARLLLVEDGVQRIPGLRERVRLVSFSVDPERDRPADLKNYAERFGADTGLWTFLTGERGEVARLCQEGFLLPVAAADRRAAPEPSPEIVHSDRFILVDPEGRIRGYYQPLGEAGELERLLADLERLAGERSAPAR